MDALSGFLRAGLAGLFLGAIAAAAPVRAELRVTAPPDGAVIAATTAILIGDGAATGIEVLLNGRKATGIAMVGKAFTGTLALVPGKNVVVISSGALRREIALICKPQEKSGIYRYHDPVVEGGCKACHPQGVGRTTVVEAKLCRSCHDPKDGAKILHGPIGAGQCTVCHDPHGSSRKGMLVAGARELCVSCHDQNRSRAHLEHSGEKPCTECHDPHGSGKKFLLH